MIKRNWKWIVGIVFALVVGYCVSPSSKVERLAGALPTPTTETSMYVTDPTQSLGSQGLTVGTNGTTVHTTLASICTTFAMPSTTINATSSLTFSCAVPNLPSAATLGGAYTIETSFPANTNGLEITGASASTTAGWIIITAYNNTTTATSSYPNATSSIYYQISF